MTDLEKEQREVVLRNTKTLVEKYEKLMFKFDDEAFKNYKSRVLVLLFDLDKLDYYGEFPLR